MEVAVKIDRQKEVILIATQMLENQNKRKKDREKLIGSIKKLDLEKLAGRKNPTDLQGDNAEKLI
jgi:hypothetical protein